MKFAIDLIPGVGYRVEGREASQWFVVGTTVTFVGSRQNWIDKGTSETVLLFVEPERGEVPIVAEQLTGLIAIIPPMPENSVRFAQSWSALFTRGTEARVAAFRELEANTGEAWTVALVQRAQHDPVAALGLWEVWSHRPEALQSVEKELTQGRVVVSRELRHLLALARRPFFLAELEREVASDDLKVVRSALEELELLRPDPIPAFLRAACAHSNPAIAIKAQYIVRGLEA